MVAAIAPMGTAVAEPRSRPASPSVCDRHSDMVDRVTQNHLLPTIVGRHSVIDNMDDFRGLDAFFRIIEQGLAGYVDGEHFYDLLAEDVVFDAIIAGPDYPRHVVGRDNFIELCRGYGVVLFLDRCYDLRTHYSPTTSTVVLEYSSAGKVVATGNPYANRYISVFTIKNRKVSQWRDYFDPLRVFAALEGRRFEGDAVDAG
jgi:ketosteroid isomerase-like protein